MSHDSKSHKHPQFCHVVLKRPLPGQGLLMNYARKRIRGWSSVWYDERLRCPVKGNDRRNKLSSRTGIKET